MFQHTAARRRLVETTDVVDLNHRFQHTAARRRLGTATGGRTSTRGFNTQPPEGGWVMLKEQNLSNDVSTHSRPKAAGQEKEKQEKEKKFQHTAARRRLVAAAQLVVGVMQFQHTAARRRLEKASNVVSTAITVSTHSRPKAAGDGIHTLSF